MSATSHRTSSSSLTSRLRVLDGPVLGSWAVWAAGLVVGELVAQYAVLNGNSWSLDDNFYLGLARQFGFTWHWLMTNYFGHWAIGYRAVFSLQIHLMPFDYRWAMALMLVVAGACAFLLFAIVKRLVGGGLAPVLAAGFLGISVLLVRGLQWWSFGLQGFPTLLADLLCVYAYLRYQERHGWRWVGLASAALAGGLLFYEKPVYVLLYMALIRLAVFPGKLIPRALAVVLWRERGFWLALGAVVVLWAYGYHESGGQIPSSHTALTAADWLRFSWIYWGLTLVPAAFGVTFPASGLSAFQIVIAIAFQLAVAGAIVVSVARRASAWRVWAGVAVCVLLNGVLLGTERMGQFGAAIGNDPRYVIDFVWIIPLFVCLAFAPTSAPPGPVRAMARFRIGMPRRLALVALGVAAAGYVAVSVTSIISMQSQWPGRVAAEWEHNLQSGVARLRRTSPGFVLAGNVGPWYMSGVEPYNQLSDLVVQYVPGVRVDGPLVGSLVAVDGAGEPEPTAIVQPPAASYSAHGRCLPANALTEHRLPAPTPTTPPGSLYALVSYTSSSSHATAALTFDHGPTYVGGPVLYLSLAPDAHQSIAWLGNGSPPTLTVSVSHPGACVTRIDIVTLR